MKIIGFALLNTFFPYCEDCNAPYIDYILTEFNGQLEIERRKREKAISYTDGMCKTRKIAEDWEETDNASDA